MEYYRLFDLQLWRVELNFINLQLHYLSSLSLQWRIVIISAFLWFCQVQTSAEGVVLSSFSDPSRWKRKIQKAKNCVRLFWSYGRWHVVEMVKRFFFFYYYFYCVIWTVQVLVRQFFPFSMNYLEREDKKRTLSDAFLLILDSDDVFITAHECSPSIIAELWNEEESWKSVKHVVPFRTKGPLRHWSHGTHFNKDMRTLRGGPNGSRCFSALLIFSYIWKRAIHIKSHSQSSGAARPSGSVIVHLFASCRLQLKTWGFGWNAQLANNLWLSCSHQRIQQCSERAWRCCASARRCHMGDAWPWKT